jgi:hypothetical protein
MKVFILYVLIIPGLAHAQLDSSGVYLNMTDFQHHKLAYAINCKTQKHKIKFARSSIIGHIKVTHNDSIYALLRGEIFGYRDCKGNSYRFIEGKSYTILNPSEYILLYMYGTPGPHGADVEYLFSRGTDGAIMKLSKENLKKAFPENNAFQKKIDQIFGRRLELTSYDKGQRMYVLNWLYAKVKE